MLNLRYCNGMLYISQNHLTNAKTLIIECNEAQAVLEGRLNVSLGLMVESDEES